MSEKAEIINIYGLSPLQQGILFHSLKDEVRKDYVEQVLLTLEGEIDISSFKDSIKELVDRYDILRTNFIYNIAKTPKQIVFKKRNVAMDYIDISYLNEHDKKIYVDEYCSNDKNKGFDLSRDILIRVSVLKVDTNVHKVIWNFHHIILDGWSSGILMQEFFTIYNSIKNSIPLKLETPSKYIEYINWLKNRNYKESKMFWNNYLKGYNNNIQVLKGKGKQEKYVQSSSCFKFDFDLKESIEKLARENSITVSVIFQAMWGVLLQKYNNENDVVFGLVVSGRNAEIPNIEKMLGLFINTIPIRVNDTKGLKFLELLKILNENLIERSKHEYYPLSEIQSETSIKNDLINHVMIFQNYPVAKIINKIHETNSAISIVDSEVYEQINYNFKIEVSAHNDLAIKITYNSYIYENSEVKNIFEHLTNIAETITHNPDILVEEIKIISESEEQQMLSSFNELL